MKIYRIEHPERGTGPFSEPTHLHRKDVGNKYQWSREYPGMGELGWHDAFGQAFGCTSKYALVMWFGEPDIHSFLADEGFTVAVYEAQPSHRDDRSGQACFDRSKATEVLRIALSALDTVEDVPA